MKKIFSTVFFFIFSLFILLPVHAQTTQKLRFALIPYQTREDLDVLFANSTRVLNYLDGEEMDNKPLFMALLTKQQEQFLTLKHYQVRIIDEDTDITRYTLRYNPVPNSSEKLAPLGDVTVISSYYTLLRLPPGKQYPFEGEYAKFFAMPFQDFIATPILRERTAEPVITNTPTGEKKDVALGLNNPTQSNSILPYILGMVFLIITVAFGAFFFIKRRKNTIPPPQPPTPPPVV